MTNTGWKGPVENQHAGWDAARTHGMSKTPTYYSWHSMLQRCMNPRDKRWKDYGGRGIQVCGQWRSFENFLADMGVRPTGLSLDRIDNDGNYEPGNCTWSDPVEQLNNTRRNRLITYDGSTKTLADWARYLGIKRVTLSYRLKRGWSLDRSFKKDPSDTRNQNNTSGYPGVFRARGKWAAQMQVAGRRTHLGVRSTPEAAYQLRLVAQRKTGKL